MRVALSSALPYLLSLNSILPVAADIMWQLGVVPLQGVCFTVHFSLSQFSMIVPPCWVCIQDAVFLALLIPAIRL